MKRISKFGSRQHKPTILNNIPTMQLRNETRNRSSHMAPPLKDLPDQTMAHDDIQRTPHEEKHPNDPRSRAS